MVAWRGDRLIIRKLGLGVLAFVVLVGLPSAARAQTVTLTPSVASPQKLGTPVTWTAAVQSAPAGHTYDYQFAVTFNGQAQIVRDFNPTATFAWVPYTVEGAYQVSVVVRDITTAPFVLFAPVSASFTLLPWVTAPLAAGVVNPTPHPLVALFSGPPCTIGHQLLVRFHPASSEVSMTTNLVPCSQQSANFLVAGMYASTAYLMHWEEYDATNLVNTGADLGFTTGALPSNFPVHQFQVNVPATAHDAVYPVILWQFLSFGGTATDLAGNVIWYTPVPTFMARMDPGGYFYSYGGAGLTGTVTQYDLAGNAMLQTNLEILNEQLAAKGYPTMTGFNAHEARHLPNGDLLLLGSRDVVSTSAQGGTPANPVDIVGDMVLVLDHNLQLLWAWDSFAHQDINRLATLGDLCTPGGPCAPFNPSFTQANDWLHTNFAQGTADGNIILSQRSQDWVIKINYANGTGDGSVIWRMGAGGDFTLLNPLTSLTCGSPLNVFPWFTHQHDTAFQFEEDADSGGGTIMTIFDDGNTRSTQCPGTTQYSRGMVLFVNETARQIYMETVADLGAYSFALGSGQLLAPGDGNLYASYGNGYITLQGEAQSTEVGLGGQIVYQLQVNAGSYRTYRMQNLYTPTFPFTSTGVYTATATPLQFGSIPLGKTEVLPLTISNFGLPGAVTVGTSTSDASYGVLTSAQNTCLAGITAGQSCTLPVEFDPTSIGEHSDFLDLAPSAGSTPAPVALVGFAGAPQISSITPNYGAPAALINISGTNFGTTNGSVTVGGAPAYIASWSNTAIAILVPSNATTGNLVVTVGGGSSNGVPFTFYPYPSVTGFSPSGGAVGTPVTITGIGLQDGGGNGLVTFNGAPAAILSQTSNSIQVDVPAGAATGPITVRANGDTVHSSASFDVSGPIPQINGISPNYGAPAAAISITGTNFGAIRGAGSVTIGGAPSYVVSWSNTAIVIQVPSAAATGNLVVTAGGGSSNGVPFTFYPYPSMTGFSPSGGAVGTPVTITGIGLQDGGGNGPVTFNGAPAAILSQTSTSIQVDVPAGADTGPVSVRANGDTVYSSSQLRRLRTHSADQRDQPQLWRSGSGDQHQRN